MAKDPQTYDLTAPLENYPAATKEGYSAPVCISCPRPSYTADAYANKVQGVVKLAGIVGKDGHVRNIIVIQRLPAGLTLQAINAVSRWKVKPALGPDGQPAEVWQMFELFFQLSL